ncbi:coiled-coil domain-containing protein 9 [Erythrolamprus reginae]|uniref:coiled-coil domain-containing protein 9 n=1 Tax=Erythrolamprus reginae TaxID=121349 RepID=UPI00396C43DF
MSASLELRSREEKDAELDKRIEALRRKNEALVRRYQEIEEDRRKAEQEGVAVTGARKTRSAEAAGQSERRRAEAEDVGRAQLAPEDRRAPGRKATASARGARGEPHRGGCLPRAEAGRPGPGADGEGGGPRGRIERGGRLRGRVGLAGGDRRSQEWEERRRRNIEQMNEEMEKIAEYERGQRDGLQEKNPVRNFLDDPRRSGAFSEDGRREGSRRHVRNWGGGDFEKVKTGQEPDPEPPLLGGGRARRRGPTLDMTLSMTGRERAEYTRWKQEREQIDRDRLARHRQPTGEWRREWDAEKTDPTPKEGSRLRGSLAGKHEPPRPPPTQPTFGEFVAGQPGDRDRRVRGRGRPRGSPPKSYSSHENRWGKEGADRTPPAPAGEEEAGAASVLQAEPQRGAGTEEEEEDEWEDVSGEEEEEEEEEDAEANSSRDSSSEDNGPRPSRSPRPQRKARLQPALRSASPREAATTEGPPMFPLGDTAEGYEPVSDWGEEMELRSPRAGHSSPGPLAEPREELPAGIAGVGPLVPLAAQGSLPMDPPAAAPEAGMKMGAETPEPRKAKKGEHLETEAPEAAP